MKALPDWLKIVLLWAFHGLVLLPLAVSGFVLLAYGMAGWPPL